MPGPSVGPTRTRRRHASSFTPLDLDLVWLLDAADASIAGGTMTLLDGTGGSYSATGTTYPAIGVFPGTADRPALIFDGVNDHLDGSVVALPAPVGAIYTLFYVAKYTASGNRFLLDMNTVAGGADGVAFDQGLDGAGPSMRKKGVASSGSSVAKTNVPVLVEHVFRVAAAHTSAMRINGVATAVDNATAQISAPTGTGFGLGYFSSAGPLFYFAGALGVIGLARGALTVPQQAALSGWAALEFGIT